jgi:hypothetical protein
MQYGGRPFTPWAAYEGGMDLTYCLGTENSVAAFAQGLDYSRLTGRLLDAPATASIPRGMTKTLRYGTLFAPYGQKTLDGGISAVERETNTLVCQGPGGRFSFNADSGFSILKGIEKKTAGF